MIDYKSSNLKPEIVEAVLELGYETPTPIQAECIPFIMETSQDLIANAQTGTGKTAAFGLPILQQIDDSSKSIQAIILSPTRELAIQISNDMQQYASKMRKVKITTVYGGASIEPQITALKRGVHIVVGTPGRVLDLVKRRILKLQDVKWLVLDEADEMLNMGFKDDLDAILETTSKDRQTLLFSATLPKGIIQISKNYMNNPHQIAVAKANLGADTVDHHYYQVSARDKYSALKRIADMNPNIYAIIFCRTRRETKEISEKLIKDNYSADSLHGDLSQAQREHVMSRFRHKNIQILVATDVAARGLDVKELTHVINFSLPDDPEVYVHRSGRTGRAGSSGISISILHSRENRKIREIQQLIGRDFTKKKVPGGQEICERQLFATVETMENVDLSNSDIDDFMDVIYEKLGEMSKEEVIKRFVALEFNRFLDYYKNAKDLNVSESANRERNSDRRKDRKDRNDRGDRGDRRDRGDRGERRERKGNPNMQRCYVNIGSKDNISPSAIIGIINRATPDKSVDIGDIEILKKFSFFEVDPKFSDDVISSMNSMDYHGTDILVEKAESKGASSPSRDNSSNRRSGGGSRNSDGGNRRSYKSDRSSGGNSGGSSSRRSGGKDSSRQRKARKQW
ncbi:MAG: ATP-dependent helicase [Bacteroidetes bacterium]|nr:MAG: ATP-dependent helicase [Bacteroidota bacterium]